MVIGRADFQGTASHKRSLRLSVDNEPDALRANFSPQFPLLRTVSLSYLNTHQNHAILVVLEDYQD